MARIYAGSRIAVEVFLLSRRLPSHRHLNKIQHGRKGREAFYYKRNLHIIGRTRSARTPNKHQATRNLKACISILKVNAHPEGKKWKYRLHMIMPFYPNMSAVDHPPSIITD
ncbi:hypothetical protein CRENBAI_005318 [Crenichthys baileyi]|uniref:Uncharacterized protein n=1 Tax=Crenichthys baileyi TaxID=28760 RepID=A0AAV9RV32_9TELE